MVTTPRPPRPKKGGPDHPHSVSSDFESSYDVTPESPHPWRSLSASTGPFYELRSHREPVPVAESPGLDGPCSRASEARRADFLGIRFGTLLLSYAKSDRAPGGFSLPQQPLSHKLPGTGGPTYSALDSACSSGSTYRFTRLRCYT